MATYNLSKGPDNDTNGQVLKDWINNNQENITNLKIIDNGAATIENMCEMFAGISINSIDISELNTANVTDMYSMFGMADGLTSISNFNTSNVTNMGWTFSDCSELITIHSYDTSNVTDMGAMFSGCSQLTDIPEYNTAKVTNMNYMFGYCNNLSNAAIQNIINMCINSNVPSDERNLSTDDDCSPLNDTKFDSSYYTNRLSDLTNAGWSY